MSSQRRSTSITATFDISDEFAPSSISPDGKTIQYDLPTIQRILRVQEEKEKAAALCSGFTEIRVEIINTPRGDEPGGSVDSKFLTERYLGDQSVDGTEKPTASPGHTPDPSSLIANVAGPVSSGKERVGWIVMEARWISHAKVSTYRVPTEWKVTQLVGMDDTKLAVLGRDGCGKTIVEIYQLIMPFEKLFEKVFTYGHKDIWQFGADGGGTKLILGCQNELGILDIDSRSYEAVQINKRVKGWGSKRVRALCCDGKRILLANDRDLTLHIFTMTFTLSSTLTIQDHVDCVWSIDMDDDHVFICGGIAGEAFAMDWQGKMMFNFRPPEAESAVVPAVVRTDRDGFTHVFWLVKVDGSFRAVDFYYNVKDDSCFAEVRLDKKVKYMTSVSRSRPNPEEKTMDARTVVMTDEGDLHICDSIFTDSRGT